MRYIDNRNLGRNLPEGWADEAAVALEHVRNAQDKAEAIADYAHVWKRLKPELRRLSHHKCWYCESRETRSDSVVDHFRPKGRVKEAPEHPGYWWLAFLWTNYRFCCTYCNSRRRDQETGTTGGKHDHFPLLNPAARAQPEQDPAAERPALLDPTTPSDCIMLSFSEDGRIEPRYKPEGSAAFQRAAKSIELYHLEHTDLVEARLDLFQIICRLVNLGKTFFDRWKMHGDAEAHAAFDCAFAQLQAFVTETAEYSVAARDMIRGLRDDENPWIEQLA